MYAVIQSGARQYRVQPGEVIEVDCLPVSPGEDVVFDQVLLAADDSGPKIGTPLVPGVKVTGKVINHFHTRKVVVFKYKPKERYRRKSSQRRHLTRVRIDDIVM